MLSCFRNPCHQRTVSTNIWTASPEFLHHQAYDVDNIFPFWPFVNLPNWRPLTSKYLRSFFLAWAHHNCQTSWRSVDCRLPGKSPDVYFLFSRQLHKNHPHFLIVGPGFQWLIQSKLHTCTQTPNSTVVLHSRKTKIALKRKASSLPTIRFKGLC